MLLPHSFQTTTAATAMNTPLAAPPAIAPMGTELDELDAVGEAVLPV